MFFEQFFHIPLLKFVANLKLSINCPFSLQVLIDEHTELAQTSLNPVIMSSGATQERLNILGYFIPFIYVLA